MQNARVAKNSDMYQYVDWAKTLIPKGSIWYWMAAYPFDFEWKYHSYPQIKVGTLTWADYILFYNPYWSNNPFNFNEPIVSWNVISFWSSSIQFIKLYEYKNYAKIYQLK